jgi:hypothetical protein
LNYKLIKNIFIMADDQQTQSGTKTEDTKKEDFRENAGTSEKGTHQAANESKAITGAQVEQPEAAAKTQNFQEEAFKGSGSGENKTNDFQKQAGVHA